jgi:CubicO group peptidase (beta-lactamase class C family)
MSIQRKQRKPVKKLPFLYFLLISYCFGRQAAAQSYKPPIFTDPDRMKKIEAVLPTIDKIYKEYAEKNHFPGFTYGVVVDGKLIHTGTAGYTNISKKIPATTQSLFRIASMSKSFTTMAILQLRDAGKLNLDDRADKYISEMRNTKLLTADAPAITIRHLLTHAAGFPEDNPWGDRQLADTNDELLKLIQSPIAFSNTPGVAYEYSNLGITLLGYIIQKVSGKTYQQFINESIFKPLGMTHTKWEYAEVPADKLAHGYRWRDGQWTEEALLHDGAWGAMGGLITSIEDFSKYMAMLVLSSGVRFAKCTNLGTSAAFPRSSSMPRGVRALRFPPIATGSTGCVIAKDASTWGTAEDSQVLVATGVFCLSMASA